MSTTARPRLADDLLEGADAIAEYVYGDATERRRIYHLVKTSRFPFFRLGAVLCARKSVIDAWIEQQETRNSRGYGCAANDNDPLRRDPANDNIPLT